MLTLTPGKCSAHPVVFSWLGLDSWLVNHTFYQHGIMTLFFNTTKSSTNQFRGLHAILGVIICRFKTIRYICIPSQKAIGFDNLNMSSFSHLNVKIMRYFIKKKNRPCVIERRFACHLLENHWSIFNVSPP